MEPPIRLTVLISGNGSNLQAVIDQVYPSRSSSPSSQSQSQSQSQTPPPSSSPSSSSLGNKHTIQIVRVISNRKDAFGLERAKRASIPTTYHNLVKYKKQHPATPDGVRAAREEYDAELARLVLSDEPDLVACLGFMHVLSPRFLEPLERDGVMIVNLHPALPGEFNGANAIERAHAAWLEGKINRTGVMIHKVISEVDMGTPLIVKEIPFVKGTDEDLHRLEQRVHEVEWGVVLEGIKLAIEEVKSTSKSNRREKRSAA